jgi:DNA-binding transcriptional ArsR family regulator
MAVPARSLPSITEAEHPREELLDRVFFALSDPVRRAILKRVGEKPRLVSELAAPFDISLQAVSRHIQVLVHAGLVQQERTGRIARCSLEIGSMFAAAVWINEYSRYWQAQFDALVGWLGTLDRRRARAGRREASRRNRRTLRREGTSAKRKGERGR